MCCTAPTVQWRVPLHAGYRGCVQGSGPKPSWERVQWSTLHSHRKARRPTPEPGQRWSRGCYGGAYLPTRRRTEQDAKVWQDAVRTSEAMDQADSILTNRQKGRTGTAPWGEQDTLRHDSPYCTVESHAGMTGQCGGPLSRLPHCQQFEELRRAAWEQHLKGMCTSARLFPVAHAVVSHFMDVFDEVDYQVSVVFHGTRYRNFSSIQKRGLVPGGRVDVPVANGSAYGSGVYTAHTTSTPNGYASWDPDGPIVLACLLLHRNTHPCVPLKGVAAQVAQHGGGGASNGGLWTNRQRTHRVTRRRRVARGTSGAMCTWEPVHEPHVSHYSHGVSVVSDEHHLIPVFYVRTEHRRDYGRWSRWNLSHFTVQTIHSVLKSRAKVKARALAERRRLRVEASSPGGSLLTADAADAGADCL